MEKIHFIAIGGQGMSGIASILLQRGFRVSGSDLKESDLTGYLASQGAVIHIGHREANLGHPDLVVVSSAIGPDNPELRLAREKGIPVIHRMDMLLQAVEGHKIVAVAGSHGKTTVTSMVAWALTQGGLDPTFLIGGRLPGQGTSRLGSGDYAVFETDESDGSFLKVRADVALVTNIDDDHLDHWGSLQNLETAFFKYLESSKPEGVRVVCADDPALLRWSAGKQRIETYGFSKMARWQAVDVNHLPGGMSAVMKRDGASLGILKIGALGKHNLQNALGAAVVAVQCGLSAEVAMRALGTYPGGCRR